MSNDHYFLPPLPLLHKHIINLNDGWNPKAGIHLVWMMDPQGFYAMKIVSKHPSHPQTQPYWSGRCGDEYPVRGILLEFLQIPPPAWLTSCWVSISHIFSWLMSEPSESSSQPWHIDVLWIVYRCATGVMGKEHLFVDSWGLWALYQQCGVTCQLSKDWWHALKILTPYQRSVRWKKLETAALELRRFVGKVLVQFHKNF